MDMRTLEVLNRRLLAKQYLSRRASGRLSVVRAAEGCCGVNSQDYSESFSSFWARTAGFTDKMLLEEFRPRGELTRTWTVRGTMHTFPSRDYHIHVFGSGQKRVLASIERRARRLGVPRFEKRVESLYQPLLDEVKGIAVTTGFIKDWMIERLARLGLKSRIKLRRGWSSRATLGPAWTGITEMSYLGLLVSAGRRGSESVWMRTSDWLGSESGTSDPDECVVGLVGKYIEQYGPVTRSDIQFWNNRLFAREVDRSLVALKNDLVTVRYEGSKETFYSTGGASEFADPPAVIILPEFDSLIMGYRDRSRFLSPERLKAVSRSQGMISRTILIDGFVCATWGRRRTNLGTVVEVRPFRVLSSVEQGEIEDAFAAFGDYLRESVSVKYQRPDAG